MISRPSLAVRARSLVPHGHGFCARIPAAPRRFFASAAPESSSYQTSQVSGVNFASRDSHGPTTKLAVVSKAGTRYEPLPGLTLGLAEYAFKNTGSRSALRITRESELLGGQLHSTHTREAVVVSSSFLRADLPYFVELLAEVLTETRYSTYEMHEDVERTVSHRQAAYSANAANIALDHAHATAFHAGLGFPIYPSTGSSVRKYTHEQLIAEYAGLAHAKPNFALICDGASTESVGKWVEQFFQNWPTPPATNLSLNTKPSAYHGGEQRAAHVHSNAMVIAFPGSSYTAPKPEVAVLAALLGGQSSIKWTSGSSLLARATAASGATVSTSNIPYSDAGLLAIQIAGSSGAVRTAAEQVAKVLRSVAEDGVAKEDLAKAIAKAKFDALDATQARDTSVTFTGTSLVHGGKVIDVTSLASGVQSVTAEKLKTTAKTLLNGKASVATVGDLFVLPYAEDLGLRI